MRPPIDATKDWALVRLARRVCSKGVLAMRPLATEQIMAEAAANRVFQVSYHRDFTPWKLAYAKACPVSRSFESASWHTIAQDFAEPAMLLLHTCDTGGASSGSPLLLETAQGPEVIGINVGTYVQSKVEMQDGHVTRRFKSDTVANTGVSCVRLCGQARRVPAARRSSAPSAQNSRAAGRAEAEAALCRAGRRHLRAHAAYRHRGVREDAGPGRDGAGDTGAAETARGRVRGEAQGARQVLTLRATGKGARCSFTTRGSCCAQTPARPHRRLR